MTASESRGLDLARALMARELEAGNGPEDDQGVADLRAALDWINRQQSIDIKRRQPRGFKYRR